MEVHVCMYMIPVEVLKTIYPIRKNLIVPNLIHINFNT